ncbi:MAG TPA: hypothetical protein VG348_14800 [Acidimicrobiia bacterium]|nr:hypothetical protein [Acidimicrobiia bacterium]
MRTEHRAMREEFRRMRRVHRARRKYDDYRWWRGEDDVTALEELQRDLEEAAADVAERIKRVKVKQEL